LDIHLLLGLACVLLMMETMLSFLKFAWKKNIFICDLVAVVEVWQGKLYNLYCDIAFAFKGDELWSFCGLLQFDHEQIHTKWVTNYNMDSIEHQTFILNRKKT
jgi:hypothetical protein